MKTPSAGKIHAKNRNTRVVLTLVALVAGFLPTPVFCQFTLRTLPGSRGDGAIAWHDVNGDGRKDLVRQAERRLEVHLLDERHRLFAKPNWRVEIVPPWDLWAFADVRDDLPGEELLALSPEGVGWISFHRKTTSTARMELLVKTPLPVAHDGQLVRPGQYVIRMTADGPPSLILPSRSALRIFRRRARDTANASPTTHGLESAAPLWQVVDEIAAPLRPWPRFEARSSTGYLIGFDRLPLSPLPHPVTPLEPGRFVWRQFGFRSSWSSSGGWFMDWNGDGRLDWLTSNVGRDGKLQICLQMSDGRFDRKQPISPSWPKPLAKRGDSKRDGPDAQSNTSEIFWPDMGPVEFGNLADVNGDGRLDLVHLTTIENWAAPKTRVAVFLQSDDGTFPSKPDSLRRLGAVVPTEGLPLVDLDGDGDLDMLLLRIDLQIASVHSHLKAFARQGLETYLGAYLWREGSGYGKRATWEKKVIVGSDLFELSRDPQALMHFDRDLTGDGYPDLALRLTRNTIGVFALVDPRRGFAENSMIEGKLPFAVENIECDDFDGDGRTDILVEGWDPDDRDRAARAVLFGEPATRK